MKPSLLHRLRSIACMGFLGITLSSVCHAALDRSTSTDAQAPFSPIPIVAAQRVYGNVIEQLGGNHVHVVNLATQLNQDPHLLTITPKVGRELAAARLVAYNGAAYDAWLLPLLSASDAPNRKEIAVAALIGKRSGDNPHIWYLPEALRAFAHAVHAFLIQADPNYVAEYDARLQHFLNALASIETEIASLRKRYEGVPITATEPVFDYMAQALGLEMRQQAFQRAVMMETQPSAKDILSFQNDLQEHRVQLLIYNTQTTGDMTRHMLALARKSGIPVLSITETLPDALSYQDWILGQLHALDQHLARKNFATQQTPAAASTGVPSS